MVRYQLEVWQLNCILDVPCLKVSVCVCSFSGMVESAQLPFTQGSRVDLQGGSLNTQMVSLQEMKDIVLTMRIRPPLSEQWSLDEVSSQLMQCRILHRGKIHEAV